MPVVVGVARSGTTLLRLMLDAHPELAIPPETGFLIPAAELEPQDGLRDRLLETVTGHETWRHMGISANAYAASLAAIEPFDRSEGVRAFYRLYAERFTKPRWGDKTPYYNGHLDKVQALLPEARFIHLIRDGRDVAVSIRGLWFSPGDDVASIARRWMNNIRRTRRLAERCAHYLEVRYERLVEAPEAELARVCEFIELPYDDRMLRYHERSRQRLREQTPAGLMDQPEDELPEIIRYATRPPDSERIHRWRREMPAAERRKFERVAGSMLGALGYEVSLRARARGAARRALAR